MSELNFNWVKKNFNKDKFTFFEIGCADLGDSVHLKKMMPKANVYAFECASHWLNKNLESSVRNGIHYFHVAVSDIDGYINLYPSLTQHGESHLWSSSIFELKETNSGKTYGNPYKVPSVTIETFCKRLNVKPDFIHIDAEGAELKIFKNLGNIRPKCVWAEIAGFHHYDTKTSFEEFDNLMISLGYECKFNSRADALYCLNGLEVSPYKTKKLKRK